MMSNAALAINFDVLDFVKKSKEYGVDERFAELQARKFVEMSSVIHDQQIEIDVLKEKEPATKKDLEIVKLELQKEIGEVNSNLQKEIIKVQKEIKNLEIKLLLFYGSGFLMLLGILAKGFHWL